MALRKRGPPPGDDTLAFYLAKSELVVSGTITNGVDGVIVSSLGVEHRPFDFAIGEVIKGSPELKGRTVKVVLDRWTGDEGPGRGPDQVYFKDKSDRILFLKKGTPEGIWQEADFWFAVQFRTSVMEQALRRGVAQEQRQAALTQPATTEPGSTAPALYARSFKVDIRTLITSLDKAVATLTNAVPVPGEPGWHGGPESLPTPESEAYKKAFLQLRQLLASRGVDVRPPSTLYLSTAGGGMLMARATLEDLEKIESALHALGTPAQVRAMDEAHNVGSRTNDHPARYRVDPAPVIVLDITGYASDTNSVSATGITRDQFELRRQSPSITPQYYFTCTPGQTRCEFSKDTLHPRDNLPFDGFKSGERWHVIFGPATNGVLKVARWSGVIEVK